MNRQGVLTHWLLGKNAKASSLSCHDGVLYSYATPIAVLYKRHAIVAKRTYSMTTSCQEGAARGRLAKAGITWYPVWTIQDHRENAMSAGLDESVPPPILADRLSDMKVAP